MSNYDYDLFISYRRVGDAQGWIRDYLVPSLTTALGHELENPPRIFVDYEIDTGADWPSRLGDALGKSRVLLCLWSKQYLNKEWCARELAAMRAREQSLSLRTPANPSGCVAISIIHDGHTLPDDLGTCQRLELERYFNPYLSEKSLARERMHEEIKRAAIGLSDMIENAPPFQAKWPGDTAQSFFDAYFDRNAPRQSTPPCYTELEGRP